VAQDHTVALPDTGVVAPARSWPGTAPGALRRRTTSGVSWVSPSCGIMAWERQRSPTLRRCTYPGWLIVTSFPSAAEVLRPWRSLTERLRAGGAAQRISSGGLRSNDEGVSTSCRTRCDRHGAAHAGGGVKPVRPACPECTPHNGRRPPENGHGPWRANSRTDGLPAGDNLGMLRDVMRLRPRGWAG
jgi:hypothetical protein